MENISSSPPGFCAAQLIVYQTIRKAAGIGIVCLTLKKTYANVFTQTEPYSKESIVNFSEIRAAG